MSIVQSFLGILLFFISLSNTLRCTINCDYKLNLTTPFYIPHFCNQTRSAGQCRVDITVYYDSNSYRVIFTSEYT
jgi:hypothetical protein